MGLAGGCQGCPVPKDMGGWGLQALGGRGHRNKLKPSGHLIELSPGQAITRVVSPGQHLPQSQGTGLEHRMGLVSLLLRDLLSRWEPRGAVGCACGHTHRRARQAGPQPAAAPGAATCCSGMASAVP